MVRTTRPPVQSYEFLADDEPTTWTIGFLKTKLISRHLPEINHSKIRIIHGGTILSDDVKIADLVKSAECREILVLYLINLDTVSTKSEEKLSSNFVASTIPDPLHKEDNIAQNVHSQDSVSTDSPVQLSNATNCHPQSDAATTLSQTIIENNRFVDSVRNAEQCNSDRCNGGYLSQLNTFDADKFYDNYKQILKRINKDTTAAIRDLNAAHNSLFAMPSEAFVSSFSTSLIDIYSFTSQNSNSFWDNHMMDNHSIRRRNVLPTLIPVSTQVASEHRRIQGSEEAMQQPPNGRVNDPMRNAVADLWAFVTNRFRAQDPIANILFLLKISLILCLLYLYEGTSRLLLILAIALLIYVAQRFGLAGRWFSHQRHQLRNNRNENAVNASDFFNHANVEQVQPPSEQQPTHSSSTSESVVVNGESLVNDDQQREPNEQNRQRTFPYFNIDISSILRILTNFVIGLFFSIVPLDDNLAQVAAD